MRIFDLSTRPGFNPPPPIAVNGKPIGETAIAREAQHHPANSPDEARQAAARALVIRELLLEEAARLGIEPEPETDAEGRRETEEEALISTLLRQEVRVPEADRAAAERYYKMNKSRFRSPDLYEARHILFAAAADDAAAYDLAQQRAREAIDALAAAPAAFASMAEALSACPSAKNGGNLGQVTADQVTPAFAAALRVAEPGRVHGEPVTTPYGVHVVELERRIEGRVLPFELVEQKIKDFLEARVWQHAVRQYVGILAGRAAIEGIALEGAASPLVQ